MPASHSSPRLIVFDLGKVLLDFDYRIAAKHLAAHSRFDPGQIVELLLQTPLLLDYEIGRMTSAEFHLVLTQKAGLRLEFAEFARLFGDIFSPIDSMLQLLEQVRANKYTTAVLSNTNELAIQFIRQQFPFFAGFAHHILSYEHRAMKPDPALYHAVELASGMTSGQILFIDDRPENVQTAHQLGWHAFVHHDPAATRQTFARFGLIRE
jgi:HAD superfamily hydrolase (TIGR01509 family)